MAERRHLQGTYLRISPSQAWLITCPCLGRCPCVHRPPARKRHASIEGSRRRAESVVVYNCRSTLRTSFHETRCGAPYPIHDSGTYCIAIGLAGKHQFENATLALHLSRSFLEQKAGVVFPQSELIPQVLARGLELTRWPGRCQKVQDPTRQNTYWFLDGAHTVESLQCCFGWFASPGVGLLEYEDPAAKPFRVLIFNCTSGRSGDTFLGTALETIKSKLSGLSFSDRVETFFDKVVFCTNITYTDGHFKGGTSFFSPSTVSWGSYPLADLTNKTIDENDLAALRTQHQLGSAWAALLPQYPESDILILPSIQHAIQNIDGFNTDSRPVQVLVSGSLHLVGGVIEVAGLSKVAL